MKTVFSNPYARFYTGSDQFRVQHGNVLPRRKLYNRRNQYCDVSVEGKRKSQHLIEEKFSLTAYTCNIVGTSIGGTHLCLPNELSMCNSLNVKCN